MKQPTYILFSKSGKSVLCKSNTYKSKRFIQPINDIKKNMSPLIVSSITRAKTEQRRLYEKEGIMYIIISTKI